VEHRALQINDFLTSPLFRSGTKLRSAKASRKKLVDWHAGQRAGVLLMVKAPKDLAAIRKLAFIKLAN
jgi:hypothetical protein